VHAIYIHAILTEDNFGTMYVKRVRFPFLIYSE